MNNIILKSFLWKFIERCGAQGVTFIVSIILARLLEPSAYGVISLVLVFTSILEVFVDSGLGSALVQKKGSDNIDFSSVFFFNILICIVLYLLMFFLAPHISIYYNNPRLTNVIRVLSVTIIISGLRNVQQAYVSKNLLFNKNLYAVIIGSIFSAITGIFLAYKGFGVWALVVQHILSIFISTLFLWILVPWRPVYAFSFKRLSVLLSFSWKLLVTGLIDKIYNNLRVLVIGKRYSTRDLAYYNTGAQYPYTIVNNINNTLESVLFPVVSGVQTNINQVFLITRRAVRTGTYIIAPLMMGLAAISDQLIILLLTDKWLPCSWFIKIFSISFMFYPVNSANVNAIKALGRSDIILKMEMLKKILGIVLILLTMSHGVKAIAIGLLACSFFEVLINAVPNKKLIGYNLFYQLQDIFPSIIIALLMYVGVSFLKYINLSPLLLIVLQILSGVFIYLLLSTLFHLESYNYLLKLIRNK